MRLNGTIKKWNDERGFGFIQPSGGGSDIFVHISEFQKRNGLRPNIGDLITFEVMTNFDGKKKAINVLYFTPGLNKSIRSINREITEDVKKTYRIGNITTFAIVIASAVFLFLITKPSSKTSVLQTPDPVYQSTPIQHPIFSCDGRTHCSQMTSCAEAKYFITNCPATEMDGDNDGIPCEKQWCTNPLSN
jgi:cold shock CspA family protein